MVDHALRWTDDGQPAVIDKRQRGLWREFLPAWFGGVKILEKVERRDDVLWGGCAGKGDGLQYVGEECA